MTRTRVALLLLLLPVGLIIRLLTLDTSLSFQPVSQATPVEQMQEDPEVVALQAQLEQMRRSDERLLQMVNWALSALLTVGLVLVGYSWFSSGRAYDRDKDALRQELRGALLEQTAKAEETSRARADDQYRSLSKASTAALAEALSDVREGFDDTLETLKRETKIMKYDLLRAEADSMEGKGHLELAIGKHMDIIEVGRKIEWEWMIARGLESIKRLLKEGAVPDGVRTRELTFMLNELPKDYAADVEITKTLLLESRS